MAKPRASANRAKSLRKGRPQMAPKVRGGLNPPMMQPPPVIPPGPPPGMKEDTNPTPPHAKI